VPAGAFLKTLKANRPTAYIKPWLPTCQNPALRPPAANAAFATGSKLKRHWIGRKTSTHYSVRLLDVSVFMKLFICILVFITFQITAFSQGVILTAGQSYVLTFDSINYSGPYIPPSGTLDDPGPPSTQSNSAWIFFVSNELDDGTSVLLWEIYSGSLTDTPETLQIVGASHSVLPEAPTIYGVFPSFPNLQGAFRVTMISGTAELSGFSVSQIIGSSYYTQSFPVPEPSSAALIAIGFGLFLVGRFRKRELFSFTFVVRQKGGC
jgi:hypothetical protein